MTMSHSPRSIHREAILFLFHHIILPPKLPQKDDYDPEHELLLLEKVIDALRSFSGHFANESADVIGTITSMIVRLKSICGPHGDVTEVDLLNALEILGEEGKHIFEILSGMVSH
jgi:hypothetical protein